MRKLAARVLLALGLVAALGLATSAVASAGSGPTSAQQRTYNQQLHRYNQARNAIDAAFQSAVQLARETYFQATSSKTSVAQRSAARQAMETAIIEATAVRSEALVNLGKPPVLH